MREQLSAETRGVGVMVEILSSQLRATLEGLTANRDELRRDTAELDARLEDLESTVRRHSADLRDLSAACACLIVTLRAVTTT